ncbi:TPA: penicillin-binding protein 2 [Candidatus Saccharibacteria bacterium]|nr:penicillin-binding protein 2 [Candidatus Saccharibacteria bacterium]HIO87230.1 penicillin-binding protein 2 [Candidatus Saccharibacteria bacterium]
MSSSPFIRDTGRIAKERSVQLNSVHTTKANWLATHDAALFKRDVNRGVQRPITLLVGAFLFIVILSTFAARLFSLQVSAGTEYSQLANGNRIREKIIYAERGNILDRNGEVLARNVAGYQVTIEPHKLPEDSDSRTALYTRLASYLEISVDEIRKRAESEGLDYVLPIALGKSLDQTTALRLEVDLTSISGVNLELIPMRYYEKDLAMAHVIGYTSLANHDDLRTRDDLALVDYVGRGGVEEQYDSVLRGENGYERYEVDALGKPLRILASKQPQAGKNIYLTIDKGLQKQLYDQLTKTINELGKQRASGVIVGPQSGDVLAMVSLPTYDNNLFSGGISSAEFKTLVNDTNQPLYNKVLSGTYPTGSTIKPLVASAGLQEGNIDINTTVTDRGSIYIPSIYDPSQGFTFYSWNRDGLGTVNVQSAIAKSSNIFFYSVGGGFEHVTGLGIEKLAEYYSYFGLGESTGIDLPNESVGLVPTPTWKQETFGQTWVLGDTYNTSIGQGDLRATPLQMALATNAAATGQLMQPRVFLHAEGEQPADPIVKRDIPVSQANRDIVRGGMKDAIYNGANCSCIFAGVPVTFAGKTGTAQNKAFRTDTTPNHGWFTSFAPYDNPELGTVILIEESQTSGKVVPPAVETYKYYFNR